MNPLETIQRVLTWLCGIPPRKSDSERMKIAYIFFTLSLIFTSISYSMAFVLFIYKNVSVNLEKTLFSLCYTIAHWQVLYQSIAIILLRHKMVEIFERLLIIYNQNENGDSFHLLKQTNEKCEWIRQMYFKYVLRGYPMGAIITANISIALCYLVNGRFDGEKVFRPNYAVLPWNQSTLLGYLLEIGYGIVCDEIYIFSNGSLLILFTSMCLHHQTFYKIFRDEAKKLNDWDEHRSDAKLLRQMVSLHISAKNWFRYSANTYSPIVLVLLISSTLMSACVVFQLDLQMKHPNFNIFVVIIIILVGISNLFAYCYFGKIATESYEKMTKCVYGLNWHELLPKVQKQLIIVMANTQQPIYYHGFGVAVLNLETFLKFIRAIFTYYMIFKTLTSD